MAKWMVVIKETPFILDLYNHPSVKIITFDKKYIYNVRGRNNRNTTHLIITNY
jgi:DNA adenine methylase